MPNDYYSRKPGEKIIIQAFMIQEIEERNKQVEAGDN